MSSTRTVYTGHGVIDIEAGTVDAAAIKAAAVVAEQFYDNREHARIAADAADSVLEAGAGSRAGADRDRAFPRAVAAIGDERKRRRLPGAGEFRAELSSRQRKDRSVVKRRLIDTAPRTQLRAMQDMITDPDRWSALNGALRGATGDARALSPTDRRTAQRMDRLIQSYERASGRGHVVYAVVELPTDAPVTRARDVPETLAPGARVSFDQYTMCTHTMAEASETIRRRRGQGVTAATVIVEIETTRGMYLGRSDSIADTSHVLPRGLGMEVVGIDAHADHATATGGLDSTLVVQLRESARPQDYQPPVTGRRVFRDRRVEAVARAAAREKGPR